jgi:hypothetical protein
MDTAGSATGVVAHGPRRLLPTAPSPELMALRTALSTELDAWAAAENSAFQETPPSLDELILHDHRPAYVGRELNTSAHTFTLDFLAATEGARFALRLVEAHDDPQSFIEWLLQLPEVKRTYGFDTVAGLVVLRSDPNTQLAWQNVLARSYDATYFVDPPLDGAALAGLAGQIVGDLLDHGSTARLWDLWEHERTETDQREYVLGKTFLQAYVEVDDDETPFQEREDVLARWGRMAGADELLTTLMGHLDTLGLPYDRDVPGGMISPLLRRYLPGFTWPLVIDDRFSLMIMEVPPEPMTGAELVQWTTLARCSRYWLDKAGDLHWNERSKVPLLVLSAPVVGPPYTPLSPVELLAGAGWSLVTPAELSAPERVQELLARAGHRPVV